MPATFIDTHIETLEAILQPYQSLLGEEFQAYRNHVYRMVHIAFYLHDCSEDEREKILIAAAFHDIGIWLENTVDYIPPSIPPAMQYLKACNLDQWADEVRLLISEHHKLRAYKNPSYPLVEVFRQADLVDFSLGLIRFSVDKGFLQSLNENFPNAGFHRSLARRAGLWLLKHPLRPLPMMKW